MVSLSLSLSYLTGPPWQMWQSVCPHLLLAVQVSSLNAQPPLLGPLSVCVLKYMISRPWIRPHAVSQWMLSDRPVAWHGLDSWVQMLDLWGVFPLFRSWDVSTRVEVWCLRLDTLL